MNIYFDIGGTNFRYYLCNNLDIEHERLIVNRNSDIFSQIFYKLEEVIKKNKINSITVALPGIIKNNCIYGVNNLDIKDETPLIETFNDIKIKYINDGDAYILGVSYYMNKKEPSNILGLIFGTGVGGGLIIQDKLVLNAEVHQYFEKFMKDNYLNEDNVEYVTYYLSSIIKDLIMLLNLDKVVIGGYVNKVYGFKESLASKIELSSFYKTRIVFTNNEDTILLGLMNYRENYK